MRVPSVLGPGLLAVLVACSAPAPVGSAPPTPPSAPASAPAPSPRSSAPVLPPVQDATGLRGDRLVARPVRLPGASADGTARLEAGGRTYLLAPARRAAPGVRPALVLVLQAANTTLREEYDRYGFDALRDHGAAVAVASTYAATWNAGGGCCGRAAADGVDDVAVVAAVRDDAVRRTGADAGRVALLGHSVGALMAWRLVCTPAFGAAAVVAAAGTLVHPCPRPLPRVPHVLALHGEQDASVPVDGSDRVVPLLGIAPPSVRDVAAQVAAAASCRDQRRAADTVLRRGCAGGGSVRLTVLPGRGHAWEDLDGTRRAAVFLREVLPGVR